MNSSYTEINKQYTAWLDTLGFAAMVVHNYQQHTHHFLTWLKTQGVSQINHLTQKHINQYFNYLESRPNKNGKGTLLGVSHLNQNFIAIDKLLEFLHAQGLQTAPSPTNLRMKVDKQQQIRKIETLSQTEIKTLYATIENTFPNLKFTHREQNHYQLKLMFTLYYGCGLRLSEGATIRFRNIDFERRTVFVEKGKNYKDRFIPMSEGVYNNLQDYIYNFRNKLKLPHDRLFLHGKSYLHAMLKHLQNVCEDEQIQQKRLSMHVLRHSIATHLLQNGMSIENISQFLGHSSLESTQIYTHLIS